MSDTMYYIHPNGIVDEGCYIGKGTRIWAGVHIMSGAQVGEGCNIGENCFIEGGVVIGDHVTVKNNIALYSGVVVEDDVFLGPSCAFTNVVNPRSFISRKDEFRRTIVRKGASIGANATIICGHSVGQYAMVGAGAVVTRDVPDYALVYGNPAKAHSYVCQCGEKLKFVGDRAACLVCGKGYTMTENSVMAADNGIFEETMPVRPSEKDKCSEEGDN